MRKSVLLLICNNEFNIAATGAEVRQHHVIDFAQEFS